jgi:outer membrane protein TolC
MTPPKLMNPLSHPAPIPVFACVFAASLVAACASLKVAPEPLDPAAALSAYAGRTLDDPALREFLTSQGRAPTAWPMRHWTLDDLALVAIHFHTDYRLALARQQAVAREGERDRQRPNPQLVVKTEHSNDPEARRPWSLGLELGFPLRRTAGQSARAALADLRDERAALEVADTAWRLRGAVRDRLLDLVQAEEDTRLLELDLQLADAEQNLVRKRADLGTVSQLDVGTAAARAAESATRLAGARARSVQARIALAHALGITPEAVKDLKATWDSAALPATFAAFQERALQRRQDVRGELIDYAQSEAQLQIEAAGRDMQWTPGYKWDKGANVWSLGLALVLPLLHDNSAAVAAAATQRDVARRRFEATQAHAIAELATAWSDWHSQRRTLEAATAAHGATEQNVARGRRLFGVGAIDRLELLRSESALVAANLSLLEARHALHRAWARAEDAARQPLGEPAQAPGATAADASAMATSDGDGS